MTTKEKILAHFVPLLIGCAFLSAVFYQGFYTEYLSLALTLLAVWAVSVLWGGYPGLVVPKSSVVLSLTLYWGWLWVAAFWGRVSYLGIVNAWWLGTLPLVFWLFMLSPKQDEVWRNSFRWIVLVGVALAVTAMVQMLAYSADPAATFRNRNSLAALLNLVAIPLSGYFLLSSDHSQRWQRWLYGAVLFLLIYVIGLIAGRGAALSGGVALIVLAAVAWWHVPKRMVAQLAAIALMAFFVPLQFGQSLLGERMGKVVANPWEAGADRIVIWEQSWQMLKDAPWMGVGLGHYALYWPLYRNPSDVSAGFFAHNDYLQIWIEAGLPGLLLLLAVLVSVFVVYFRAMREKHVPSVRIVEMTALFCGLLAVAMHSFLDFNLYVLSILVLAGLMLGRLHSLALATKPVAALRFSPSRFLSEPGYRILVVLITAFALVYFVALGLASFEYKRGLKQIDEARWEDAYATLDRAARYFPSADNVTMSKADLIRHFISLVPETSGDQRRNLFDEAEALFVRAERLNPFRSQTFAAHALLYEQNPSLTGPGWAAKADANYRHALEADPRGYQVRYLYAGFLLRQGRRDDARGILEGGMSYRYDDSESIVSYLTFVARIRREVGDREGAAVLDSRIHEIMTAARARSVALQESASK